MSSQAQYTVVPPVPPLVPPEQLAQDTIAFLNVKLPTIYIDVANEVDDADLSGQVFLNNRIPQPAETDVPISAPIELMANVINDTGLSAGTITITDKGGTVMAWTLSGGFHGTYSASVQNGIISQGAVGADEFRWQLIRATPWTSQDRVVVRVQLTPTVGAAIDVTYFFFIEDVTVPALIRAETRGLRRLRLTFNEPVVMSADEGGALRVRDLSGRLTFVTPNVIEVETRNFPADLTGEFICVSAAVEAVNNRYYLVDSSTQGTPNEITTVEDTVVTEGPNVAHRLFSSPYHLQAVIAPERIYPAFTPCVIGAVQINDSTVELLLDQQLTPNHTYQITANGIGDAANPTNIRDTTSLTFTSEGLPRVAGREFSLWNFIPQGSKRDDTTRDMERLIRILDEPVQLMLADIDRYDRVYDFDTAEEAFVDAMLLHLGNPYTFFRSDLEKRKVASHLVETYKVSGAEAAIEQAILQILGFTAEVQPFNDLEGQWILGEGELGDDTYLGPSSQFLLYSFEIDVFVDSLTDTERAIIQEIGHAWRPAHTHLIRINEVGPP